MVVGKIHDGTLNLPHDYEFVSPLTKSPLKFTCTGPHMLARVLTNCFYKDIGDLAMDIAAVLRQQLELIEADTVQLDEACIAGYPEDAPWAAEAINLVLEGILNVAIGSASWKKLPPLPTMARTDSPTSTWLSCPSSSRARGKPGCRRIRDINRDSHLRIWLPSASTSSPQAAEMGAARFSIYGERSGPVSVNVWFRRRIT